MAVMARGVRELGLRFDQFPTRARASLAKRISGLTERLLGRAQDAAPVRTGLLRTEIRARVFADKPDRVAGYVSVYAPSAPPGEYGKAATMEYGTHRARRIFARHGGLIIRLGRSRRRSVLRMTTVVHLEPRMYLRGALAGMREEIDRELAEAIAEAANQGAAT
jgi:hypothetical protein